MVSAREAILGCLAVVFVVGVFLSLGRAGWRTLVSVAGSGILTVVLFRPLAKAGYPPLLIVWPFAAIVCAGGILLIGGWNRKAVHALAGCLTAVGLAAWLPVVVGGALHLTGLDVEFGAAFHLGASLWFAPPLAKVDFAQLLMAGLIIGGLGATMDVAITVSAAMEEVRRTGASVKRRQYAAAGLRVGRDVLGMMAVSIVLITLGSEIFPIMMRHIGGLPDAPARLLGHEGAAAGVLGVISAVLALGLAIPLTVLFAVCLPGRKRSPGEDLGNDDPPPPAPDMRAGLSWAAPCLRWAIVFATVAAAIVLAFAVDRSARAWYHTLPPSSEGFSRKRTTKTQRALGRVVALRPAVTDAFTETLRENPARGPSRMSEQPVCVEILTGHCRGAKALARNVIPSFPLSRVALRPGSIADVTVRFQEDRVLDAQINRPPVRYPAVLALIAGAMALFVLFLGPRGAALMAALVVSVLIGSVWLMPWVLSGRSAMLGGLLYVLAAMAVFITFSGEWNIKGLVAMTGGLAGILAALIVVLFGARTLGLTGFSNQAALFARQALPEGTQLDFVAIACCGVLLGIAGLALDLAMSVASAQQQVLLEHSGPQPRELLGSGLRVSRAVAGTMLLTLVFVWLGGRLHVLMLPEAKGMSVRDLLRSEMVALSALWILAAGLGLLATGPATAFVGSLLMPLRQGRAARFDPLRRFPLVRAAAYGVGLWAAVGVLICAILAAKENSLPRPDTPKQGADAALALWRSADLAPDDGQIRCDLAHVYITQKWYVLAHAEAQQALLFAPGDADAYYVAGVAAAWLSQTDEAKEHLERVLKLDPNHRPAKDALRRLFPLGP